MHVIATKVCEMQPLRKPIIQSYSKIVHRLKKLLLKSEYERLYEKSVCRNK